jgi:hypothetical protein
MMKINIDYDKKEKIYLNCPLNWSFQVIKNLALIQIGLDQNK